MKAKFKAVVETGSCSRNYEYWEERVDCGHLHRTVEAAERCGMKHRGDRKENGRWTCSALWYNFCVHDQDGRRID